MRTHQHGEFHWNELMSWDVEKAKAFYGASLGWTFEEMPMAEGFVYTLAKSGDKIVGGMMQMSEERFKGIPEHWFSYIAVDDVDARVARVEAAGGVVATAPFDVGGVGRIAIVRDACGGMIGLIAPAEQQG